MEIYLMILLPISAVFLLCMLIILVVFEKGKRQTMAMINEGYYFFQKNDAFIGVPPEYMDNNGGLMNVIRQLGQN